MYSNISIIINFQTYFKFFHVFCIQFIIENMNIYVLFFIIIIAIMLRFSSNNIV